MMNGESLEDRIKMLQDRFADMLTKAAQEGRTAEIPTISEQMQQEIEALVNAAAQSALAGTTDPEPAGEEVGDVDDVDNEQDPESDVDEADDLDWEEEESEDEIDE